ncbi:MAG: tetratricopeptide repeat protein [Tenacibaculum sp.]|nr:tetratricopeptide repeat protein [Tenacibaculum sp.]
MNNNSINRKIFELVDCVGAIEKEDKIKQKKEIEYVNKVWDSLPSEKMQDTDRTLLALVMIDICLEINDFDTTEKWIEIYLHKQTYKPTINYHWGVLAFHKGDYQKAYDLFKEAQELSNNRELDEDPKYLDFYQNPEKYIK